MRHLLFILVSIAFAFLAPVLVSAQSGSFVVRPAKIELAGAPGETVQASIALENQLGVPATFAVSFEDVAGSENPDDAVTLLGGKRGPYPMRDLLRGTKNVSLVNGEEKRVPISITIPQDASPGGLYGSVIFTPVRQKGDGNVIPDSRIGVLVFLRITGVAKEEGRLKDFSYEGGRVIFGRPSTEAAVTMLFENTGTVHLSPYGVIAIDPLFSEITEVEVDPWYVLPKSVRRRALSVGEVLSYGPNAIALTLHAGFGEKTDKKTLSVWVFPSLRSLGITGAILAVLLLLVLRRGRHLHV
jgi:hypothetical protein